jgi:hypothetical protein
LFIRKRCKAGFFEEAIAYYRKCLDDERRQFSEERVLYTTKQQEQDFCDLINGYDFKSMPIAKQMAMVPLIKRWANANLPLF